MNGNNGYAINPPERCDWDGAEALQRKIRAYWAPQVVSFSAIPASFHAKMRTSRVDLRSDMINGLPRGLYLERRKKGRGR